MPGEAIRRERPGVTVSPHPHLPPSKATVPAFPLGGGGAPTHTRCVRGSQSSGAWREERWGLSGKGHWVVGRTPLGVLTARQTLSKHNPWVTELHPPPRAPAAGGNSCGRRGRTYPQQAANRNSPNPPNDPPRGYCDCPHRHLQSTERSSDTPHTAQPVGGEGNQAAT